MAIEEKLKDLKGSSDMESQDLLNVKLGQGQHEKKSVYQHTVYLTLVFTNIQCS